MSDESIIPNTTTRSHIMRYLERMEKRTYRKTCPDLKGHKKEVWSSYFKMLRPYHFMTTFSLLLCYAEQGETLFYEDIKKLLSISSPFNVQKILDHINMICREKKWPPYTVLVKSKDTEHVGAGFFKACGLKKENEDQMRILESRYEDECFDTPLPDITEFVMALKEYMIKG